MSDSGDSGVGCLLTGDDQPLDFSKKSSTNSTSKKEGTSLLSSSNHQQGRKAASLNNLIQTIANNNSSSHDGRRDDRHHVFTTPSPSPPDGHSVSSLSSPSLASHSLLTTLPGLSAVAATPSKEGANSTTANLSQLMSTAAAIAAAAASNGQGINSSHLSSLNGQPAVQTPSSSSTARSSSHTRPFKAYSTTPASGLGGYYGLPMSPEAAIMAAASEQAYLQFRQQMLSQKQEMKQKTHRSSHNGNSNLSDDNSSNCSFDTTTNGSGNGGTPLLQQQRSSSPLANNAISQQSLSLQSPPTPNGPSSLTPNGPSISSLTQNGRKRGRPLPNDVKDEAYWERRRKNNEAAKRSRDARRAKEDEIAIRAAFLETENMKLRLEVAALKQELTKLVSQIQ